MMRVLAAVLLLSVSAHAFAPAPLLRLSRAATISSVSMKLSGDDFVPSETWYQEYMGEQGLRYNMGKSPQEIKKEGDYNIWEAMFGQTSNNAAKKKLKEEARTAAYKNKDPETSKYWLSKYGHPRFFPSYIDKSGEDDPEVPVGTPGTLIDINKASDEPEVKATRKTGQGSSSFAFMPDKTKPAGKDPTKVQGSNIPRFSPAPKDGLTSGLNGNSVEEIKSTAQKSAPSPVEAAKQAASNVPKAGKVIAAKVTEVAENIAPTRVRGAAPKPKGNLSLLATKKKKST